jgi:hypothetical protein
MQMADILRNIYGAALACAILSGLMVLVALLGHRYGRWRQESGRAPTEAFSVVGGAIFALFGLLIAFTFNGGYGRYEHRRSLIVEEACAVGTAYLRLDMLPAEAQGPAKEALREYTRNRAEILLKLPDADARARHLAAGDDLQARVWRLAMEATSSPQYQPARISLVPALTQMFDCATRRTAAAYEHPPPIVFMMLALLALACAWLIGHGAAKHDRLSIFYATFFSLVVGFMVFVILDMEFPGVGMVNLSSANQFLVGVHYSMGK